MTGSGLKNSSTDKVRRSSTDSARSSVTGGIHLHDDLDLLFSRNDCPLELALLLLKYANLLAILID